MESNITVIIVDSMAIQNQGAARNQEIQIFVKAEITQNVILLPLKPPQVDQSYHLPNTKFNNFLL
ncbi:conserved hypothetical protein [Ricinus communis]|uniref:Uncharacterized protein n=1 Tax=Ricinus communis TaxID=3988 RepID=B9T360_RICCO|nr:conserved hypothetical protein [Ricinus communis]